MVELEWDRSFRIIHWRYPAVGIFDRIVDPADLDAIVALEARTNDRIRDELGEIALVRPSDRIAGPGATPIMAAFTLIRPGRFSDGTFGVYYAAHVLDTAIAETIYHTESFYRASHEPSADIDMRVYAARISGAFEDLRSVTIASDARLDPDSYLESQRFAAGLYEANECDGIVFPSVRDATHRDCVACLRPKSISAAHPDRILTYRWNGVERKITVVFHREALSGPEA